MVVTSTAIMMSVVWMVMAIDVLAVLVGGGYCCWLEFGGVGGCGVVGGGGLVEVGGYGSGHDVFLLCEVVMTMMMIGNDTR